MAIDAAQLRVVVTADTSGAQQDLKAFSSTMKNVAGAGMAAVGGFLTAKIAEPIIGIGVSAIKTAASFEKSMNVLEYVTGAPTETMAKMQEQALQLGADTVFSAGEAAEGMVELAKAGMESEDVMASIPGVMNLAAAGGIAVNEAAGLAASTLNTFGLEASKSGEVADILAAASNASALEVKDLAYGVQNAGSVFAANGQSVESLATMMALMANNGIDAGTAATALKTMTLRLTAPTNVAAKAMEKLGLEVFDAEGNMRDYHDILEDMEIATKDMSDAQRGAAFQVIFGQEAVNAANVMVQEGIAGYEEMTAKVLEQGAAAEMADAQNKGLEGALSALSGSIETLQIKLALPFLDTLAGWMEKLAEYVNKMGEIPAPVVKATLAFLGFAGAVGLALVAAASLAGIIGLFTTGGALAAGTAGGTIAAITFSVLGLAAAAAVAWYAWSTNWGNIQGKTEEVIAVIQPLIDGLLGSITAFGTEMGKIFTQEFADFQKGEKMEAPTFDFYFTGIAEQITTMVDDITAAVNKLDVTTIDWWTLLNELIVEPIGAAMAVMGFSAETLTNLVTAATTAISEINWGDLGGAFGGLTTAVITQLGNVVNDIIADLTPLFFLASLAIGEQVRQMLPKEPVAAVPPDLGPQPALPADVFSEVPENVATRLTAQINEWDWAGVGTNIGKIIVAGVGAGMLAVDWVMKIDWQKEFKVEGIDIFKPVREELIRQLGTEGNWAGVLFAFKTQFDALIQNIVDYVMGFVFEPTATKGLNEPTSVSDRLRGVEDVPFSWAEFIPTFEWSTIIPEKLDWKTFIPNTLKWAEFLSKLNWKEWLPDISGFGGSDPKTGGAGGKGEGFEMMALRTHRTDPNVESLFKNAGVDIGAQVAASGTEFGSNFKTAAAPVGTEIGNDVAAAIKTHAALTKGPDPILSQQKNLLEGAEFTLPTLDWTTFVVPLNWAEHVMILVWDSYVMRLAWESFVTILEWGSHIPDLSWGNYISTVDWGRYIPTAPIPQAPGANASGTPYWRGGATWVGEEGPELVTLPRGSRIYSNEESTGMGGTTINVFVDSINSALDIEVLAAQLAKRFQQKMRS